MIHEAIYEFHLSTLRENLRQSHMVIPMNVAREDAFSIP